MEKVNNGVEKQFISVNVDVPREWFRETERILIEEHGVKLENVDKEVIRNWIGYLVGYSSDESKVQDLLDMIN